ncbi:hypothetical protein AAG570_011374 [Ranatra chinensis]|uniref:Uncharacterized protein n=1 Tax=Ranatra chinensis TaxID=642074 RepID=A0ABD0YKF2_9HEMI
MASKRRNYEKKKQETTEIGTDIARCSLPVKGEIRHFLGIVDGYIRDPSGGTFQNVLETSFVIGAIYDEGATDWVWALEEFTMLGVLVPNVLQKRIPEGDLSRPPGRTLRRLPAEATRLNWNHMLGTRAQIGFRTPQMGQDAFEALHFKSDVFVYRQKTVLPVKT